VPGAQVIAVRLDERSEGAEDRGGVTVYVGKRVNRDLVARWS
jgi:hypothetical protein